MSFGGVSRRDFIGTCAWTVSAGSLAACASVAARPVPVIGGRVRLALSDFPELAEPQGAVTIQPGPGDPIHVLRQVDGTYLALSPRCTHKGCIVDVQEVRLVCPCHGSMFSRDGKVMRGPAEQPLDRYDTRLDGATIEIFLGERE